MYALYELLFVLDLLVLRRTSFLLNSKQIPLMGSIDCYTKTKDLALVTGSGVMVLFPSLMHTRFSG
jgi:hypothetical protein